MKTYNLSYNHLPFSKRDKHYISEPENLKDYITAYPSLESLIAQAKIKQGHQIDREELSAIIRDQYASANIELSSPTLENIEKLREATTFTVITAHQPSLLTGPLYYIFKILSCINLCEYANSQQSEFTFIPIFINGGEDHDFEEISKVHLYNNTVTWKTDQTGSVGRMLTDGLSEAIEEVFEILGDRSKIKDWKATFIKMANDADNYAHFQRGLVDLLFREYGLVQFSSDDKRVKDKLLPVFTKELEQQVSYNTVIPQQQKIQSVTGYEPQAYVREINLFYLDKGIRQRIEKEDGQFKVIDSDIAFTSNDIPELAYSLSPNVILRPITQEYILPNVAYIGGGGELSYWLDRKSQFEKFGIPFPLLIRRNSAGIIKSKQLNQWKDKGYDVSELFLEEYQINNRFVEAQDDSFDLSEEVATAKKLYAAIAAKAKEINPTMEKSVKAMAAQEEKQLRQLESRLKREIKQRYEVDLNRLMKIQSGVLPSGSLQERHDNILKYLSIYGPEFIQVIKDNLPVFSKEFTLMVVD